jgi:hypothetical protein
MTDITIQFQDVTGNWRIASMTVNNNQMITAAMYAAQSMYPGARIRAVDSFGRIIDIL